MTTSVLTVEGMTCGACVTKCERALQGVSGVKSATVSLDAKKAEVQYDPTQADPTRLAEAIQDAGFKATVEK